MAGIFENYTQLYPVSKTLKFSLVPMYETEANIQRYGILSNDEYRNEKYKNVKEIFDNCHKVFIEKALSDIGISVLPQLYDALCADKKDRTDLFKTLSEKVRKDFSKNIKNHKLYKSLEPAAIVESVTKGKDVVYKFTREEQESIKAFDRFATYFQGYKENRENIYGVEQGSISYRTINENFPKFIDNINMYKRLDEEIKHQAEEHVKDLLGGYSLNEIFTLEFYNKVLSQSGIEFYNTLLGGITEDERTKKQGLNEFINLKYQSRQINRKFKFTALFKQILSDREKASFIPQALLADKDVLNEIIQFKETLTAIMAEAVLETETVIKSDEIDREKIYVDKKQLAFLSQLMFDGRWSTLSGILEENNISRNAKVYTVAAIDKFTGKSSLETVWEKFTIAADKMNSAYSAISDILNADRITDYDGIKEYLDSVQECEKLLKIFAADNNLDKDIVFYPVFDLLYGALRSNVSVYNMVRNYATKKPYSTEKYKLNFENPTLANGWDQNKEYANNTMLFIKDGNYYIGILNAKNKPKVKESETPFEGGYSKMVYKLLPGPNKMLPKVFFSKKGLENFPVEKDILEGYEKGMHKKGDTFDLNFCHRLIDHFKASIEKHEDWSKFNFSFSDTSTYKDIGAFYAEIAAQSYKVTFSYVSEEQIEQLVTEGKMFFFKLYNKDFSQYSKGRKNLHTLYWNQLFCKENIENPIFKLNGEAELFYRPASIENPFVHKKGSILISKNNVNRQPVPDDVYETAMAEAANGADIDRLKARYPDLVFKKAEYDIVKDRRYSKASYSFHVPITINYGYGDKSREINKMVLDDVSWNKDVNIIGIDRGERNLIYVSVINQKGEILKQKSYNIVENSVSSVNYHKKLDNLEKSRDEARKNWKQINNIKELKEGYLSSVVKEIADMAVEYNAVIAMEDLNFGFKRGRFHIEKQVYQKFEKMLIDKLNYFADKTVSDSEKGSIRYGYQLAPKFASFRDLGKQSGIIFYVPAAYTSKIDPVTGFVNLFTSKQLSYQSQQQTKQFIKSFDRICFDKEYNCFRFDFDYRNFDLYKSDYTNTWQVYSCGENRIVHTKKDGHDATETVNATDRLAQLFESSNIDITKDNLVEDIASVDSAAFYKEFLWLFRTVVQLRYEDAANDFILSPVQKNGRFFDSRTAAENMPQDGDANGAYHIALQGLRIVKTRIKNGKILKDEKGRQASAWFEFAQRKDYR